MLRGAMPCIWPNKWLALDYPLQHAHFLNCLVTGYADDVVTGNLEDENKDVDYYFGNCVLRTVEAEDDAVRFVGVVYEKKARRVPAKNSSGCLIRITICTISA